MTNKKGARPSREEAEDAVRTLLSWIGEDVARPGLKRTPLRVLGTFEDWYAGYEQDPYELLRNSHQPVRDYNRIVSLCNIDFASHCEHHMAPIIGKIHIAYLPGERLAGISKLVRVVEALTRRLQVQERLTAEIAKCIEDCLAPRGVAVVIEAKHQCMTTRGVNKTNIKMVTNEMTGEFLSNESVRNEFMQLIDQSAD